MSRELKFRIWNEKTLSWETGLMVYAENIIAQGRIFSQYIGQKDRNGKEVYEFDIIEFTERLHEHGDTQKLTEMVEYSNENAGFMTSGGTLFSDYGISIIKVIGNAFENPELLKA